MPAVDRVREVVWRGLIAVYDFGHAVAVSMLGMAILVGVAVGLQILVSLLPR